MSDNTSTDDDSDTPREPLQDWTPDGEWVSSGQPLPATAEGLIQAGQARLKSVQCFDYVPSNFLNAWQCLSRLASLCGPNSSQDNWLESTRWRNYVNGRNSPSTVRFCEWGSGLGIAAGLASLAGFDATGIELNEGLADQSRQLLGEHALNTKILCGSYYEIDQEADIYYVYAWPGQRSDVIDRFLKLAPSHALLLICDGQDLLRVMARW